MLQSVVLELGVIVPLLPSGAIRPKLANGSDALSKIHAELSQTIKTTDFGAVYLPFLQTIPSNMRP